MFGQIETQSGSFTVSWKVICYNSQYLGNLYAMLGPGRRSLVNDWLKKVKAEVFTWWLIFQSNLVDFFQVVEPPPRLLSDVRPFPRGWQKFYKVFGDSDKNFSIDNYITEGFEVGRWLWVHFMWKWRKQRKGARRWSLDHSKNLDGDSNYVCWQCNKRLRMVFYWMAEEE